MEKIKKILKRLTLSDHSNSEIFWNSILFLCLIIIGIFSFIFLISILCIGSFIELIILCEYRIDPFNNVKDDLWYYLMPVTWIIFAIGYIMKFIVFIYDEFIEKFNRWLNSK